MRRYVFPVLKAAWEFYTLNWNTSVECHVASQRSLHYAPIFRLLLEVAVKGTHQYDFCNFCGTLGFQLSKLMRHAHVDIGTREERY